MKKILALALAVMMLGTALCALAEEGQLAPMYATVGDALDAGRAAVGEEGIVPAGGANREYYAVVTKEEGGKYFRHVANYDDKLAELEDALDALDYEAEDYFEKLEAAFAAIDEYERTLPIAYSEELTAEPLAQADLDALAGKTITELAQAGWANESSGSDGEGAVFFTLRNGLYCYDVAVDADEEAYNKAMEDGSEGQFTAKGAKFADISYEAWNKRFHADGTVEEEEAMDFEMPPEFTAVMEAIGEIVRAAENGEEVDIDALFDVIEEQFPDKKDEIEPYREMVKQVNPEDLVAMFGAGE